MWLFSSPKTRRSAPARRRPFCRPSVEALEDRTVPAALGYSALLHGTVYATAVDNAGDIYVTGLTDSSLPTTPRAFQTSGSGGAFVAKLNPTGTALIYATYLGNGGDGGTGIAVDASGDAYVLAEGGTVSTTANAISSTPNSNDSTDFLAELNPTGSGLNYATYLPGTADGQYDTYSLAGAIAVDGSGNIYVDGTAGSGLPVTAGAFQTAPLGGGTNSGTDPFFMKINPALSGAASIMYASYLGGSSGVDAATAIAVDGAGNAYLEGLTASTNFPTTSGAFQSNDPGGVDAFVAKFDPALSGAASLVFSTYLGTGGGWSGYWSNEGGIVTPQIAGGIAVDSAGNVYVTSATTSNSFPTTPGAYQTTSNINSSYIYNYFPSDVFVTKLNATGSALIYSTYLGGGSVDRLGTHSGGTSIALDASGDAFVTGWTDSTSFPTKNPVQAANGGGFNGWGGGMDAFVTELNPSGSGLLFSTYLGGGGSDYGYGIALDSAGNVYVGGHNGSSNFPTTPGAYDTASSSGFAAKINLAPSPSFSVTGFPSSTTAGVPHTFTVTALNANGTVNTGYTGTVRFTSSDPHAVLPANYTFTTGPGGDNGVHTFSATLVTAGSQSITAIDTTGSFDGSKSGIVVQPAAASTLVVSGFPASITQGTAATFTVTAMDPYGNVATGYTGTVTFSSSDPLAKLPGNYTFTAADAGVHTFNATLNTVGTESLTVTDTLDSSITGIDTGITVTRKRGH